MNLYLVTFTADVKVGDKLKSEHEVIVSANSHEDAEREAQRLFLEKGDWTAAYISGEERIGQKPLIRNLNYSAIGYLGIVNGKIVETRKVPPQAVR
jgi:hypothetical protein